MEPGLGGSASLGLLDERHLVRPRVTPPLDPAFRPAALAATRFFERVRKSPSGRPVWLALEQPGGTVSHHECWAFEDGPDAASSARFVERDLKFLLWSWGGSRAYVDGPASLVEELTRHFETDPVGAFDAGMMGPTIYGAPFEVVAAPRSEFPGESAASLELGGHLDGCRIGFDLGASDRKVAAVIDGEVCFSTATRHVTVGRPVCAFGVVAPTMMNPAPPLATSAWCAMSRSLTSPSAWDELMSVGTWTTRLASSKLPSWIGLNRCGNDPMNSLVTGAASQIRVASGTQSRCIILPPVSRLAASLPVADRSRQCQ